MPIYIDFDEFPEPATDLGENKRVQVQLRPTVFNITATDGTELTSTETLIFYTHADPVYASVDQILIEGGEIVEELPEATIYLQTYQVSTQLDGMLLFTESQKFTDTSTQAYLFWRRARMEYVKCKVLADLLRAIIGSKGAQSGRRTLADFTIDLSSQSNLFAQAKAYLGNLRELCRFWLNAVYSGGQADFAMPMAVSAVKSGSNLFEPTGIGRGWIPGGPTMNAREPSYIHQNNTKNRPRRGWAAVLSNMNTRRDSW